MMKLDKYTPHLNEVLFEEVREEKTEGGIYIPSSDFVLTEQKEFWGTSEIKYDGSKSKLGQYKVVKSGVNAPYKEKDTIVIRSNVTPEVIEFFEGKYFQINSAYIIGHEREE